MLERSHFFFPSRRRHTRWSRDWSSDVCSSDLLFDDAPSAGRMQAFLVFLDVEGPILIEVAAEVYGPQLDDGLGHRFGPAHARSFHAVLDEVFAGALHRTTGDGQATCQILVIVHATPVAVEIVRHARQHLALAATERKFGDHLANALDDLADVSF